MIQWWIVIVCYGTMLKRRKWFCIFSENDQRSITMGAHLELGESCDSGDGQNCRTADFFAILHTLTLSSFPGTGVILRWIVGEKTKLFVKTYDTRMGFKCLFLQKCVWMLASQRIDKASVHYSRGQILGEDFQFNQIFFFQHARLPRYNQSISFRLSIHFRVRRDTSIDCKTYPVLSYPDTVWLEDKYPHILTNGVICQRLVKSCDVSDVLWC